MFTYTRRHFIQLLTFLVISAILWLGFGPIQIGGPTAYVIISGNSMEPAIQVGDLVITRERSSYEIDQRVVYNHPKLGHVFHRIVDKDNEAYIFKGDNNRWLDTYKPTETELIGKYWFMIPGGGDVIRKLREPIYFTAFTLIIIIIISSLIFIQDKEEGKTGKKKSKRIMENKKIQTTK